MLPLHFHFPHYFCGKIIKSISYTSLLEIILISCHIHMVLQFYYGWFLCSVFGLYGFTHRAYSESDSHHDGSIFLFYISFLFHFIFECLEKSVVYFIIMDWLCVFFFRPSKQIFLCVPLTM